MRVCDSLKTINQQGETEKEIGYTRNLTNRDEFGAKTSKLVEGLFREESKFQHLYCYM